jgi:hypothetical protein
MFVGAREKRSSGALLKGVPKTAIGIPNIEYLGFDENKNSCIEKRKLT